MPKVGSAQEMMALFKCQAQSIMFLKQKSSKVDKYRKVINSHLVFRVFHFWIPFSVLCLSYFLFLLSKILDWFTKFFWLSRNLNLLLKLDLLLHTWCVFQRCLNQTSGAKKNFSATRKTTHYCNLVDEKDRESSISNYAGKDNEQNIIWQTVAEQKECEVEEKNCLREDKDKHCHL